MAGTAQMNVPRRLLEVAACALAAHALIYRTLLPGDGMHGYFTWYEPLVAGASLLSVLGLLLTVLRATRRRSMPAAPPPFASTFGELFGSTFLIVLLQESLERSAETGRPAGVMLAPTAVFALAAAAAVVSLALATARCLGHAVVRALLHSPTPVLSRRGAQRWHLALSSSVRPRPLAERFALRAPPLIAV